MALHQYHKVANIEMQRLLDIRLHVVRGAESKGSQWARSRCVRKKGKEEGRGMGTVAEKDEGQQQAAREVDRAETTVHQHR